MIRWVLAFIASLMIVLVPLSTSAHVLVMDATDSSGAILHIMPDDDPIAGEEAEIYFDRQVDSGRETAEVTLTIRDSLGVETRVATKTSENLTTARYVFDQQGVYTLVFSVKDGVKESIYEHTQRVMRGALASESSLAVHPWAEALLVFCVVGMAVLFVIFFNRRTEISQHSTF